jgi:HD-like signal output (HDOD) protein
VEPDKNLSWQRFLRCLFISKIRLGLTKARFLLFVSIRGNDLLLHQDEFSWFFSLMTPETRLKRIQQFIGRMPSLSTTVAKVLEICNRPSAAANDLSRVISYDPVLTGQMLKLINSAYYGLPNHITSLARAIVMLGVNTVKNMVLATSVLSGCKRLSNLQALTVDDFWAHSLCVGVLSKIIAKMCRLPDTEHDEFFIAGLLHDLGKLPIMACFPELYLESIGSSKNSNIQLFKSETMHIGFNHCQVGALIAVKWKLSGGMQEAITRHHEPAPESIPSLLADTVGAANHLTNHFKMGFAGDHYLDPRFLLDRADRMGVSAEVLIALKPQLESELEKAKVFLQISGKEARA